MLDIDYSCMPGPFLPKEDVEECSVLYSNHYGIWSDKSHRSPGEQIKMSPTFLKEWLCLKESIVYMARADGHLIGYAIAVTSKIKYHGAVSWVTQLVVQEEYRQKGVAKRLLFSIWSFSDHFAWGILSSNPFAVRALEKATRRRCIPAKIHKYSEKLFSFGVDNVSYVEQETEKEINDKASSINTKFFVDQSSLAEMISKATTPKAPWLLGPLKEGWEWFAFTLNAQPQIKLSIEEVTQMIDVSDQITQEAYSRMPMDAYSQKWMKNTPEEAQLVIKYCHLNEGNTVLDLGCGHGRHSIALSKENIKVTSVDYIKEFIENAKNKVCNESANQINFIVGDCRNINLEEKFDAVTCLYDVVGTYADNDQNFKILNTIASHLKDDGYALVSVMNFDYTKHIAKHFFTLEKEPDKLLELAASQTMEKTGNIFNPDYFMIDEDTCVVYRKEQFKQARASLPAELIVRDRRFRKDDIEEMCERVGLKVLWSKFVNSGSWENAIPLHQNQAKEILLLCQKK